MVTFPSPTCPPTSFKRLTMELYCRWTACLYTKLWEDNRYSSVLEAFWALDEFLTMYLRHVVVCQQPRTLDCIIFYVWVTLEHKRVHQTLGMSHKGCEPQLCGWNHNNSSWQKWQRSWYEFLFGFFTQRRSRKRKKPATIFLLHPQP